jgi:hypothetical protein
MNETSLASRFAHAVRALLDQPKAKAYLVVSMFAAAVMVAAACQDTAAPRAIPRAGFMWIDYGSDSLCMIHVCTTPTSQQIEDMFTVEDWLRLGPYTDCTAWADALDYALYTGNVLLIDQFDSPTQTGGYVDSTGTIYLKANTAQNGAAGFNIALGHESGHAAGYGAYQYHQTYMDNMSHTCQPGH